MRQSRRELWLSRCVEWKQMKTLPTHRGEGGHLVALVLYVCCMYVIPKHCSKNTSILSTEEGSGNVYNILIVTLKKMLRPNSWNELIEGGGHGASSRYEGYSNGKISANWNWIVTPGICLFCGTLSLQWVGDYACLSTVLVRSATDASQHGDCINTIPRCTVHAC